VVTRTAAEQQRLAALGFDVFVSSALVRDTDKARGGPAVAVTSDIRDFYRRRFDLVIEVMGGISPAFEYVKAALERGIPVVTANKSLIAHRGEELGAIARFNGVPLAFDAAVLAGVPFLGALSRRPFINTPQRVTGIINGTSHYLLSKLAAGGAFPDALQEATRLGYAEPDSSADVGGRDAAEKLTILLRLSGVSNLAVSDLTTIGIDRLTPPDFAAARRLGGVLKPLVIASLEQGKEGAWVGPALVDRSHSAASTSGVLFR
jgi:homoserine dehydrogenase